MKLTNLVNILNGFEGVTAVCHALASTSSIFLKVIYFDDQESMEFLVQTDDGALDDEINMLSGFIGSDNGTYALPFANGDASVDQGILYMIKLVMKLN